MEIKTEFEVKLYNNETDVTKNDRFRFLLIQSNIKQFTDCCMKINGPYNIIQLLEKAKDGEVFIDNLGDFWKYDETIEGPCCLSTDLPISSRYPMKYISKLRFAPIITLKQFLSNLDVGSVISFKDEHDRIKQITIAIEKNDEEDDVYNVYYKVVNTGEYITFV